MPVLRRLRVGRRCSVGAERRGAGGAARRALRDAVVLRVLAVERGLRAAVLLAAAYAIYQFKADQGALQRLFDRDLPALRDLGTRLHIDVESSVIVRVMKHLLAVRPSTLSFVAIIAVTYAVVEGIEAVGLWLLKRWGEYFTVIATAAFVPLEVYELADRFTITKAAALGLNVAAVAYLVIAKRLFGARGGSAAYHAEHRSESLLEIEAVAEGPKEDEAAPT